MSHGAWWKGLPNWLKLVYVLVAIPAWMFMAYCVFTRQDRGPAMYLAVGIFAAVALVNLIFDRRWLGQDSKGGIDSTENDT